VKLYNSLGPNPRLVRLFMLEKGIELATEEIDIMAGTNRQADYVAKNPGGQLPALELDDGSVIAETVVICEYLEERHPDPNLIGASPEERAQIRMWTRRAEQKIVAPLVDAFRYAEGLGMFKDRMHVIPQAADDLKTLARHGYEWLEAQMAGRSWVAGERFSLADIVLYVFADFGTGIGQPLPAEHTQLTDWFKRVNDRPSAEASLHPAAVAGGMRA
jgi:glutathione S-transferase